MPNRSSRHRKNPNPKKKANSKQLKPEKRTSVSEERMFWWNLSEADFDGEWSMGKLEFPEFCIRIWPKIHRFNGMNWGEIIGKNQFHFIAVERIVKEARERFNSLYGKEPDLGKKLFSTRLSNKERIWSVQRGNEGCIIWYDPDHTVYPVGKD